MSPIIGLVIAYLVGAIPAAYIAGKLFRGIDLRQHGSGNLGATNVYRVLGWKAAALVMAFDVAKGVLPVLLLPGWTESAMPTHWAMAYGIAAIAGHVRSPFLRWRGGGKGVATATGVFLALVPVPTMISFVVWGLIVYLSGFVSLASLGASVALVIAIAALYGARAPVFALCVVVCIFVFWTHRANIARLWRGEEHRFGRKKPVAR